MSDPTVSPNSSDAASKDEINSGLFAHLVMQQSNMAMMLLGKTPHPETGKAVRDVEAAQVFIDLLEMLEVKTKGNLSKQESNLLQSVLMATRMAFVETADSAAPAASPKPEPAPASPGSPAPAQPPAAEPEEEHKKKFTKKY